MSETQNNHSDRDPIVQIRGLKYSRSSRPIFDGVDIDITRGKLTAIMGPSGQTMIGNDVTIDP